MAETQAEHGHDHGEAPEGEHHAVEAVVYYKVFAALMVLLVITLAAAAVDLGPWNLPIAMLIAVAKVALIMLYFMHLKWNSPMVRFFAMAAFFWLLIMFGLTFSDYVTRNWLLHSGV